MKHWDLIVFPRSATWRDPSSSKASVRSCIAGAAEQQATSTKA